MSHRYLQDVFVLYGFSRVAVLDKVTDFLLFLGKLLISGSIGMSTVWPLLFKLVFWGYFRLAHIVCKLCSYIVVNMFLQVSLPSFSSPAEYQ